MSGCRTNENVNTRTNYYANAAGCYVGETKNSLEVFCFLRLSSDNYIVLLAAGFFSCKRGVCGLINEAHDCQLFLLLVLVYRHRHRRAKVTVDTD